MRVKYPAIRGAGFTMIEILVVIAIISILSLVVVYSMSLGNPSQQLRHEGKRLAAVIDLAIDESIFRSKEIGLEVLSDGYRFLVWERPAEESLSENQSEASLAQSDEEEETSVGSETQLSQGESVQNSEEEKPKWVAIDGDRVFRQYEFPLGIRAYLEVEEGEIDLLSVAEKTEELEEAADFSDDGSEVGSEEGEVLPNIVFMSSGEVTAFHLELFLEDDSDLKYIIDVNQIGQVTLTRPGEEDGF